MISGRKAKFNDYENTLISQHDPIIIILSNKKDRVYNLIPTLSSF